MTRIDDAVRRILRVKFSSGLFDNPLSDYSLVDKIRTQAHRNLAREAEHMPTILDYNAVVGQSLGKDKNGHNLTTGTILSAISEAVDPSTEIVYSENPDVESLKDNKYSKVKCVVVLISGRPLVVEPYLPLMDALVAAWLPGAEGQGVADVLFGDYGLTGKLPRTWFKRVDQLPMNVGDEHYDPFPLWIWAHHTQPTGAR
ncbi:UNVERIFIED_CONTAM: Periplasmic beta-glucosidase [Sesamum angustifolium]|uniref:beta-glucosidase n=1 Tax=Sesamum angustifolium TaxID=2727405 RepID=A0AAW2Q902_9LAMI